MKKLNTVELVLFAEKEGMSLEEYESVLDEVFEWREFECFSMLKSKPREFGLNLPTTEFHIKLKEGFSAVAIFAELSSWMRGEMSKCPLITSFPADEKRKAMLYEKRLKGKMSKQQNDGSYLVLFNVV
jgi:hypothetical protein